MDGSGKEGSAKAPHPATPHRVLRSHLLPNCPRHWQGSQKPPAPCPRHLQSVKVRLLDRTSMTWAEATLARPQGLQRCFPELINSQMLSRRPGAQRTLGTYCLLLRYLGRRASSTTSLRKDQLFPSPLRARGEAVSTEEASLFPASQDEARPHQDAQRGPSADTQQDTPSGSGLRPGGDPRAPAPGWGTRLPR